MLFGAGAIASAVAFAEPATAPRFDASAVARGAELAAIGNCRACHTADDGASFAGGRPLATPFGTLYSTNITPDAETGIGRYDADDFRRALHEGRDRADRPLYPAFPYDHFTLVADDDVDALYAFCMTREAVNARRPANHLTFPANVRPLLAIWQSLYFRPGRYVADPAHDAQWNRGAYLVEGLAHCGACHTPRNAAGAERRSARLAGGDAEGWRAPALLSASPAPYPWNGDSLYRYLRHGFDADHGLAAGPMSPVVDSLARVPDADVRAIVAYLTSFDRDGASAPATDVVAAAKRREFDAAPRPDPDAAPPRADAYAANQNLGDAVFAGACATCHYAGNALPGRKPVPLALATSVNDTEPRNALHIVVEGLHPQPGMAGAIMPGFGAALTDAQIVAVVQYVRARFSGRPPWPDVESALRKVREGARS